MAGRQGGRAHLGGGQDKAGRHQRAGAVAQRGLDESHEVKVCGRLHTRRQRRVGGRAAACGAAGRTRAIVRAVVPPPRRLSAAARRAPDAGLLPPPLYSHGKLSRQYASSLLAATASSQQASREASSGATVPQEAPTMGCGWGSGWYSCGRGAAGGMGGTLVGQVGRPCPVCRHRPHATGCCQWKQLLNPPPHLGELLLAPGIGGALIHLALAAGEAGVGGDGAAGGAHQGLVVQLHGNCLGAQAGAGVVGLWGMCMCLRWPPADPRRYRSAGAPPPGHRRWLTSGYVSKQ